MRGEGLLIVLNGIETAEIRKRRASAVSFNRTKWN